MVKTILLVVIAILVVFFVYKFVVGQTGGDGSDSKISVFASIFNRDKKETEEATTTETSTQEINAPNVQEGFNVEPDGRIYFIQEGVTLKDCWLDHQNSLYRIGEDGYVQTSELQDGAFLYHFSSKGEVTSITAAASYTDSYAQTDTPGLVKSDGLMVFLNPDNKLGRFQRIQYKKSSVSHMLGTEGGAEYTMPGSVQIDLEGYVYWLPYVNDPDELETKINGTLYRMLPGSDRRQFTARDVTGFRVLTDGSGKTVVYYCSRGTMFKCGTESFRDDETVVAFTEDMTYRLKISENQEKLYLVTESGYPVKKESESFRTGGMNYSLSGKGEVLSVQQQKYVSLGEYTYLIVSDEVFGMKRSAVVRQKDEKKELISSEFTGSCDNLYLDRESGRIYAEYTFMDGIPYIASITTDGDVDLLIGTDANAEEIRIYGFDEENVIVRNTMKDGTVRYGTVKKSETTPLAISVEPTDIESVTQEEETSEQTTQRPQSGVVPGGPPPTTSPVYEGPGSVNPNAYPTVGPGGPGEPTMPAVSGGPGSN